MFWLRPQRDYERLLAKHRDVGIILRSVSEAVLNQQVPHVSKWTTLQHLWHVNTINEVVLRELLRHLGREHSGQKAGRPSMAGYLTLTLGRLPRGAGQSPEQFLPPPNPCTEDMLDIQDGNGKYLHQIGEQLDAVRRCYSKWEHPVLGWMGATQWLRYAYLHTRHHYVIVKDILAEGP